MLKQTVQYKREQIKQEEIRQKQIEQEKILKEICLNIPKVKKKIIELPNLLLLMQAIEKLSEKQRKTPEEINSLNEMITMYEEKKIALAGHENTNQTLLNVNTVINSTVEPVITINSDNTAEQIVGENSFLKQIQEIQLKKVKKNEVQMKHAQKPKSEHDADGFVMTQDVLESIKLNSLKPKNSVASSPEDKPTELELKLAKRRAKADGENTENTITVPNEMTIPNDVSECLSNLSNAQEIIPFEIELKLRKLEVLRPHLNSQEFSDREFAIIEDGFSQENMAEQVERVNALSVIREDDENRVSMTLDEVLKFLQEEISALDNETQKPQTPLSMHFNSPRGDAPKIVRAISKPTP